MPAHDLHVALLDHLSRPLEDRALGDRRRHLLAAARGRVLDVGAGTGANLAHYRDVDTVVALEPDPAAARRLRQRVEEAVVPVEVVEAGIGDAVFDTAPFDTVVCTFVLCTVPDLDAALTRLRELLAPDGRLLFLEHIRSPGMWGRVQRLATPAWRAVVPGCHLDRDTLGALRRTGFVVTDCEHFTMPFVHSRMGAAVQGAARLSNREPWR
jgi:SAM-dependent methyltransferase